MNKLVEQDHYFKVAVWHVQALILACQVLTLKKTLETVQSPAFNCDWRDPSSSLEVGTPGAWLLPPTQQEKQCFTYWASHKLSFLSFEKTVSKKDWKIPGLPGLTSHLWQQSSLSISTPLGSCLKTSVVWELSTLPADLPRDSPEEQQFYPTPHWDPATSHSPRWASFCPP